MLKVRTSKQDDFIKRLENEAWWQSKLDRSQLLPEKLGWLGRLVGLYPWQTILLISGISAWIAIEIGK